MIYSKKYLFEIELRNLNKVNDTIKMLERYENGKQTSSDNLIDVIHIFKAIKDMKNVIKITPIIIDKKEMEIPK